MPAIVLRSDCRRNNRSNRIVGCREAILTAVCDDCNSLLVDTARIASIGPEPGQRQLGLNAD